MTDQEKAQVIEKWKDSEKGYVPSEENSEAMQAFMENPQQFGYYVIGGRLCYTRDRNTPSKLLEQVEAEFEIAKQKFRPAHPKYQQAEAKVNDCRQKAEASLASLDYTVKNLSEAFIALMSLGVLDSIHSLKWDRRNVNPSRTIDNDSNRMPTKKVENMSASEVIRNVESSPKFREKVNGKSEGLPTLSDKQIQANGILAWLNGLNSSEYDAWLRKDPANLALVESLNR